MAAEVTLLIAAEAVVDMAAGEVAEVDSLAVCAWKLVALMSTEAYTLWMAQLIVSVPERLPGQRIQIEYETEERPWLLEEQTMPESPLHDHILDLLKLILAAWIARSNRNAMVARNLACRWDQLDARIGTDPDLVVLEPPPPGDFTQLRLWEPGHVPPRLAVEVVSETEPEKDYLEAPQRCVRLGANELWVFDPLQVGPSGSGGPYVLQIWRRQGSRMKREYAGSGPGYSQELEAWLVVTGGGRELRIADDQSATALWPTEAEAQARRAAKEQAAKEQAEAAKEQAEAAKEQAESSLRSAVLDFCELLGITPTQEQREELVALDLTGLESLRKSLVRTRSWPL